ncbi:helix-turn-helix domain-containing protein [Halostagnicola sp. A-GB9-2]|uniref:helix-turn-helix domain-containing protein n=1 Tax=Halostagnicola sp. A-GB9-2 TaxID=3048066 RepID=UPI0024C0A459|nr:helix-turn-helix domain-containing protein [Halostagnicola sp. A-GB9-2]MDJ1434104.1 helix-turn-helix domain-containing protein [Halostagnicola sp. A-GB9-2]
MNAHVAETERTAVIPRAEGGITAEIHLTHRKLLCVPTIKRVPKLSIEPDYTTDSPTGRTSTYLTVFGDNFDAFESALEIDDTVNNPVLYERCSDHRVYRVTLAESVIRFTPTAAAVEGRVLDVRSSRDGWTATVRFPSRDALIGFNQRCREQDIQVSVNNIRGSDGNDRCLLPLTRKQADLLVVAYEEGYFDVPRAISQEELATKIGVSKSAVSQRLRRGLAELCRSSIPTVE